MQAVQAVGFKCKPLLSPDVASAGVPNATLPLMWLLTAVVGDRQAGICLATPEEQREEREWHELVRRKSSAYGACNGCGVVNG